MIMENIKFCGKDHEDLFYTLFKKMKSKDCYHGAAAYLLSLDTVLKDHIDRVFDFKEDIIKPECIYEPWQTGTSKKTTRLLFNLWNGRYSDFGYFEIEEIANRIQGDDKDDKLEIERMLISAKYYTPDEIFCCSYAPYFWQAIQLRYPEYSEP